MRKKLLFLFILIPFFAFSQQQITGIIIDSSEELPLAGVIVTGTSSDGKKVSTVSDVDGRYILKTTSKVVDITFSFMGMNTVNENVNGRSTINITLTPSFTELDGVVVTALDIKRDARSLSYSTQSIDVNTINEVKSPNFISSLSGKVAGVQIVPPGLNTGSARIVIRGNSSLTGNNQPLFVVDGMPIDNAPGDGALDYGNNAADINPADIEDIQILKGPNAAALYGSRAANGVVLITTKKSKGDGKARFNFNSSGQMQVLNEFPEYQDSYGVGTSFYIDNRNTIPQAAVNYRSWGSPMMGQPYIAIDGTLKPYLPQPNNVEDFYKNAYLFTNSFSVEGGSNESTSYRVSYTDTRNNSVVKGFNESAKHNIDIKMSNKLNDFIKLNSKVTFLRQNVDNRQYSNNNGRNPTNLYTHMARSTSLDELTPYKDSITGMEIGTHRNFSNPYWVINENPNEDTKDRLIASFNPEISFTKELKLTGRLSTDMYWWDGYEFNNIGSVIANNPDGFMRTFNTNQQNLNLEGILSYNKNLNPDISLLANIGASTFSSKYERREARVNSLLQPGLINLSNAKEFPSTTQNRRRSKVNSVFSSVSLGYKIMHSLI